MEPKGITPASVAQMLVTEVLRLRLLPAYGVDPRWLWSQSRWDEIHQTAIAVKFRPPPLTDTGVSEFVLALLAIASALEDLPSRSRPATAPNPSLQASPALLDCAIAPPKNPLTDTGVSQLSFIFLFHSWRASPLQGIRSAPAIHPW